MPAVTLSGMRAAEAEAIAQGWSEEQLLDLAGSRLGRALARFFPRSGTIIGYLGKGHNAGDALVALRILRDQFGWNIATRNAFQIAECAPLTRKKWLELGLKSPLDCPPAWRDLEGPLILLDGLLGSGSSGSLRNPLLALAGEMQWLRENAGARIAAVDLPSGIDPDTGTGSPGAVIADITFMIANAKCGLLTGHSAHLTGALALVPVEPLTSRLTGDIELISPQMMDCAKGHRPFDFHKGMAGRVAIIAGSLQYPGAAALAAMGALRGGAGLITLHVPAEAASIIAAKCLPEIMVRGFSCPSELRDFEYDSLVVGCGIGEPQSANAEKLLSLIADTTVPTVVDADALNLIAKSGRLEILKSHHVITPHPGEFRRLSTDPADLPREAAARKFSDRIPATLLLKGSRTIVTSQNQPLWCNSTGSPGMATGGQGDLLAGVIGARLAMGDPPLQAAALSAWLCGRAAELALAGTQFSEESLTPTEVALMLGAAFTDWKHSRR